MNETKEHVENHALTGRKYYDGLGMMLWLMSNSEYHKEWCLWSVDAEIIPPLLLGQHKIYLDEHSNPVGFVTWAWLSEIGKEKVLSQCGIFSLEEWNAGRHLMINDFISPWGHAKQMAKDLRVSTFYNIVGFAVRRYPDGEIRKLMKGRGHKLC